MTLTRYKQGSLKELLSIALPLMISSFSVMTMIFVDRFMLAQYSVEALNAAVNATTFGWAFIFSWMVMASISEVFVAQYNGAGSKEKIGEPVWQMIWLSVASILFFYPLAVWGGNLFYGNLPEYAIAKDYFKWMMYFGPSLPLYGALCGFFVGQGKTKMITILAVVGNLLNVLLDAALIFGVEGWIPSLGPRGAAIATSSSSIFQAVVLFAVFLSPNNRREFGTGFCGLKLKALWQCTKIGFPGAIFVVIELLGWAAFYWMMTFVGEKYITIAGICQSVIILMFFFSEGVSKAATTIAGNMIGAKQQSLVHNVFIAGTKLNVLFFIGLLVLFVFFANDLTIMFLPHASPEYIQAIDRSLMIGIFLMTLYLFFEGIRGLLLGLLTAAGDTVFLFYAGSLSVWIFMALPVYLFVVLGKAPVEVASALCVFYSLVAAAIYYWRFREGKWKTMSITG